MRPSMDKIIFLLMMLVKIKVLESKAILGCSCAKSVPLAVTIPVAPPPLEVPCPTHGYKIEVPPPPALVAPTAPCSLDVVVEAPLPVVPPPVCNPNLIPPIVKPALPAISDCGEPAVVPPPCGGCGVCTACGVPALPPAPLPLALPPPPAPLPLSLPLSLSLALAPPALPLPLAPPPALIDDFSGVAPLKAALPVPVTYELIAAKLPAAPPAPLPPAYTLPLAPPAPPCGCPVVKPDCRYVLKDIKSNQINRGRSKRDVILKKQKCLDEIREYLDSLKSTRVTRKAKKSKLVKRDIKGEYDLLQREQYEMDLTIPEIIQYMPETMLPNFKRGKCNIGCKNCINCGLNKQLKTINSALPTDVKNKENTNKPSTEQQTLNENTTESPNQHFDNNSNSQSATTGENYSKRSVNPFQNPNPNPSYDGLMPPPYTASTMELTKLAKNPGNPVWFQPQPLTDLNVDYVYDRLGHKYKVKNGSFKLVTPEQNDYNDDEEVNRSTHVSSGENAEKTIDEAKALESSSSEDQNDSSERMIDLDAQKMHHHSESLSNEDVNAPQVALNDQTMIQTPIIVGAPAHQRNPSSDQHMDKVIRDIVYKHPDFIDATQHAPGSLTLPEEVTRDETIHFLDKLIKGRLNKWFGAPPSEEVPMHRLQDLNRYSRETGTTIKFIPIVTVDKNRLNEFRQTKSKEIS